MSRRNYNWFLVEWIGGGRDVVHIKSIMNPIPGDLMMGELVTVSRRGDLQTATLLARAKEKKELELRSIEEAAGPSPKADDEDDDYSASASSWAPSDDGNVSEDSDLESNKHIKLDNTRRQYINRRSSKKILTPSNRVNAVIPKIMRDSNFKKDDVNRKLSYNGVQRNDSLNVSLPDSTKRNNTPVSNSSRYVMTIDNRELDEINSCFRILFNMIDEFKRSNMIRNVIENDQQLNTTEEVSVTNADETIVQVTEECEEIDEYENDEFNRSDDNVLITNKYDKQNDASVNKQVKTENSKSVAREDEWVPIGSGKTLIHTDQFKKVNWKTYTVATRTLLLAVFPRRILATHSLTGRKSPAFLNKPAKMCLDPKIISDVIMEIMDRFDVKENLVRSIITTKCADECKMWKQRTKKKKSKLALPSNSHQNESNVNSDFGQANDVAA